MSYTQRVRYAGGNFSGRRRSYYPRAYGTRARSTRGNAGMYRRPSRMVYPRRIQRYGKGFVRAVVRQMAEKKYWDVEHSYNNTSLEWVETDGVVLSLTNIPIAATATDTSRVGDKVTLSSLEVRHSFQSTTVTTGFARYICRVIIFSWRDDVLPTTADIINLGVLPEFNVIQPLNHDLKVKRKIWFDKTYTAYSDLGASHDSMDPVQVDKVVLNFTNAKRGLGVIHYQGGATDGVNKLYMILVSNINAAGNQNQAWDHRISTRANFIDI